MRLVLFAMMVGFVGLLVGLAYLPPNRPTTTIQACEAGRDAMHAELHLLVDSLAKLDSLGRTGP